MLTNKKKFENFEGLKCIAYLCVFFQHTGFKYLKFGGFGVSLLLILSGFLLTYNYYNEDRLDKCSIKNNIKFAIKKIKPLYFLHIVCLIFYIPLLFVGNVHYSAKIAIYKILSNIFLVQEWIPMDNSSLNECSWYLCVMMFCYFVFPYLLKYFEKNKINNKPLLITFLFVCQLALAYISMDFGTINSYSLSYWFIYRFPITRLLDFTIGCVLYLVYQDKSNNSSNVFQLRSLGILCTIFVFIVIILSTIESSCIKVFLNNHSSFLYTSIFTPASCLLIYSFALNNENPSKLLNNSFTKFVSDLGKYAFLIHYMVFDLIRIILTVFTNYIPNVLILKYLPLINATLGILITISLSKRWPCIQNWLIKITPFKQSEKI